LAAAVCFASISGGSESNPIVKVTGGSIRGELITTGGAVFKGIPYAQPPTGERRWREPMPVKAWTGIRDATQFGPICAQNPSGGFANAAISSSEDCLHLNVWTAEWPVRTRRPVLFWIPSGGNLSGGTSSPRQDGSHLARRGVVVVTMNHRLGSFGFFSHPDLTRESPHHASGNQGLLDLVAALEWVHANITQFGGDPNEITMGGVSSGGVNISALMTSALARGKFKRAIMQSGPPFMPLVGDPLPRSEAERRGVAQTAAWNAPPRATLSDLRSIPVSEILKAQRPVAHLNLSVDGYIIRKPPTEVFASGGQHKVPAIIGHNVRDFVPGTDPPTDLDTAIQQAYGPLASRARPLYSGTDPLYGAPAVQWATDVSFRCPAVMQQAQHAATGNTVFAYEFARLVTPEIYPGGNIHGLDGGFVLGTSSIRFTDSDTRLSDQMQQYWINFIRTGDPNGPGLPSWSAFRDPTRHFMQFAPSGAVAKEGVRRTQCDFYIENVSRTHPPR
jgi:para-nitrobenzyl esterase